MLHRTVSLAALVLVAVLFARAATRPAEPLTSPPTAQPSLPQPATDARQTQVAAAASARKPIPDGYRIQIPDLGIDLPIAEGSIKRDINEGATPEGFAFHLPGTSLPGESGNTYLYSHARISMFLPLWHAKAGRSVTILTPEGRTLLYRVEEVRPRVPAGEVYATMQTDDERLTLQTSTGPNPSDPRFVVIAFPAAR